MNKAIFFIITIVILAQSAITYDYTYHCSCEELLSHDCNLASGCFWNQTCQTREFSCSNFSAEKCNAEHTNYKCGWENGQCVEKAYSCTDFTDRDSCPNRLLECYWNKNNECDEFTQCSDYTSDLCFQPGCLIKNNDTCVEFSCSDFLTEENCKSLHDTSSSMCSWSTSKNICDSISRLSTCEDLSDYKSSCQKQYQKCSYENNQCKKITCDLRGQQQCSDFYSGLTELTLCSWDGACSIATDTSQFSKETCFQQTSYNYKWTADGKCVRCSDLISKDSLQLLQILFGGFLMLAI